MRILVLAVALVLLSAATAHAQATGSCAPQYVGSPSCPYQWVGITSVAFTGSGNGQGFVGMTSQCRVDFGPGARMCRSDEILRSDTLNPNVAAGGCWVRPTYQPGFVGGVLDSSGTIIDNSLLACRGWTATAAGGLTLTPGGFIAGECSNAKPVACCKPIAVGEPQASLMLPTGVSVLAMLSILKGGAVWRAE